ncbi:MAG: hypothetical protein NE327_23455 [Lentisphaeraceae bacterium]|nr:hypothetical protein [Lentisphaeraceae bacterium]
MKYIGLFFIFIPVQGYFLYSSFDSEKSVPQLILLTLVSLVSFAMFTISMVVLSSVMKLVELAVKVTCKRYLTEDRVPDLKMVPVPNDQIDQKADEIIDYVVLLIRKEEGLIQNVLKKAARMKASSLLDDLKEFQTRHEYEHVKEKELVHFLAEWKTKSAAEVFCRMPIVVSFVSAIGVLSAFIASAYFVWWA